MRSNQAGDTNQGIAVSFQEEIRDAFYRNGGGRRTVTQEQREAYAREVEEIISRHGTDEQPDHTHGDGS